MELGCAGGELDFTNTEVNREKKQSWEEACLLSVPYVRAFVRSF